MIEFELLLRPVRWADDDGVRIHKPGHPTEKADAALFADRPQPAGELADHPLFPPAQRVQIDLWWRELHAPSGRFAAMIGTTSRKYMIGTTSRK